MSLICRHIEKLQGYTPGEQPRFEGMIKLNTNENPYPPSPKVGEALHAFDYRKLRLYPDPIFTQVRQRIAQLHGCQPEQVFVGNGSDEILALVTRAFVEDAGTVGYLDPTYSLYSVLTEIRDAAKKSWPLKNDFTWEAPPADFSSVFFLTNPNAPTSLTASPEKVKAFCSAFKGLVLIDEAYADFADADCMSIATAPDNANTLVMRTLSKSFSLAGIRFGYAIGPARLIAALYKIKDSYNMDTLVQLIGLAALNDIPHMRENTRKIRLTRARLTAALKELGWSVLDSSTNFLFARPPNGEALRYFEELRKRYIFVRYFPGPKTEEYLRISIGTDEEIDRLITLFKHC